MCSNNIFLPLVSGLGCPRIWVLIFQCTALCTHVLLLGFGRLGAARLSAARHGAGPRGRLVLHARGARLRVGVASGGAGDLRQQQQQQLQRHVRHAEQQQKHTSVEQKWFLQSSISILAALRTESTRTQLATGSSPAPLAVGCRRLP